MKKGAKIFLISACALAVTAAALYLTLAGLPVYRKAVQEFPDTDTETADPYLHAGLAVPEDYIPVTFGEWTVSAPVQLVPKYPDETESDLRKRIYIADLGENGMILVNFMERNDYGKLDLTNVTTDMQAEKKAAADLLTDYAESLGRPVSDWYSLFDFMYRLRTDDCKFPYSLRKCLAFYSYAYMKHEMLPAFPAWEYHTENADGYVMRGFESNKPDSKPNSGAIIELYPKSDRNTVYTLMIKAPDDDTLYRMVNSARLDPARAGGGI